MRKKSTFREDGTLTTDTRHTIPIEVLFGDCRRPKLEERVFHVFPELPVELRRQIWKESLPDARFVALWWDTKGEPIQMMLNGAVSGAKSFLLACKESSEVYLENYSKVNVHGAESPCHCGVPPFYPEEGDIIVYQLPSIDYVDFSRDIIYVSTACRINMERHGHWVRIIFILYHCFC